MEYGEITEMEVASQRMCGMEIVPNNGQKANRRELEGVGGVGRSTNGKEKEGKHQGFQEETTQYAVKFSELLKAQIQWIPKWRGIGQKRNV